MYSYEAMAQAIKNIVIRTFLTTLFIITFSQNLFAIDGEDILDMGGDGYISIKILGGKFEPDTKHGLLTGVSNSGAVALAMSFSSPDAENFAFDVELFQFSHSYDSINLPGLSSSADNKMYLNTSTVFADDEGFPLALGLRLQTAHLPIRLYGSVGFGLFENTLYIKDNDKTYDSSAENAADNYALYDYELSFGVYGGAGIELNIGRFSLSLDYRNFKHRGDFHKFNIKDIDLGGEFTGIGIGMFF